jgi:D-glycero-D-manno-heptose 1,7-bisphosphate phosphatase
MRQALFSIIPHLAPDRLPVILSQSMAGKQKAVFLDRDGVVIEDTDFPHRPDQLRFLPRVAEAIKLLNKAGFKIIIVTNQSGVARGLFTEETVREFSEHVILKLAEKGAVIDRTYYCPHFAGGTVKEYSFKCSCRKPETGMVEQAVKDFKIDLACSFVVGDNASDIELGRRVGCRTVLVTGGGTRRNASGEPPPSDQTAPGLFEAAEWIVNAGED